jgi:hypothetical protein
MGKRLKQDKKPHSVMMTEQAVNEKSLIIYAKKRSKARGKKGEG